MQNRRPAKFNVVPNDPTGNTWALPEGAIVRSGKGLMNAWDIIVNSKNKYTLSTPGRCGFLTAPMLSV